MSDHTVVEPTTSMTDMDIHNNFTLSGYSVTALIGCGHFTKVYLAQSDHSHSPPLAVKVVPKVLTNGGKIAFERVLDELTLTFILQHPNLRSTPTCTVLTDADFYFLPMNFCPNGNMAERLSRGSLGKSELELYTVQLSCAVQYLHNMRVYHGDIRLENVLLDEHFNLVVSDMSESYLLKEGSVAPPVIGGEFPYLAPEVSDALPVNAYKLDCYAVGVCVWCLLMGVDVDDDFTHEDFLSILENNQHPDSYVRCFLTGLLEYSVELRWSMNTLVEYLHTVPSMTKRISELSQPQ